MNRVLYIQYTNPAGYPPLQHSSRILADAGWSVAFLGTGASGASHLDFPPHPNISVRRMRFRSGGWRQKIHYLQFCLWVLWTALAWRPQWIYASDSLACPVAAILTFIPGLRVIYHEHDTPAEIGGNMFLSLIARARLCVARRSELCIVPNQRRLEIFRKELGPLRRAVCVWNCPGIHDAQTPLTRSSRAETWLYYHGSIVPERLPVALLDALALLPGSVRLRVVGYETLGSHGYVASLMDRARSLALENRVEFLPAMSRFEMLDRTSDSDIGLALIPDLPSNPNLSAITGASNKPFDYMARGLALLVYDLPDWREMFIEPGYAMGCDPSPESIAAAISRLMESGTGIRSIGEAGRRKILSDWNYEAVFKPVFNLLNAAERQTV